MAMTVQINTLLVRNRAKQLRTLREVAYQQLYPGGPLGPVDPLKQLANTFSRYAGTQATAYENGAPRSSPTGTANVMERQVDRALAQVLGGAPGRGADFMLKLDGRFPLGANGQVLTTPTRSAVVSMYGTDGVSTGTSPLNGGSVAAGLAGQLSAEQAALSRETSIVAADAMRVLAGLQAFVPEAEADRVEALRALVQAEIATLVDEFGRVDEPRPDRVESYLNALDGVNGHLVQFGERAFLDGQLAAAVTLADEAMLAGYALLRNYVRVLREAWKRYNQPAQSTAYPLFSERLARASVMLPVIAEGNSNFMAAMDSIGFTENERRSFAAEFTTIAAGPPTLPSITVNDLNDEVDQLASVDGPSYLANSGQYGLELVTEQSNRLFWMLVPILTHLKNGGLPVINSMKPVAQALTHERVSWALDDLFNQFKALADLAA